MGKHMPFPGHNTMIHTSTNPEIAMDYAFLNFGKHGKVLKYEVPVSELKRLADPTNKMHRAFGPGVLSNDAFLKKYFDIGTGFTGLSTGQGFKPIGPTITIFPKGIPHRYNTKIVSGTPKHIRKTLADDFSTKFSVPNKSLKHLAKKYDPEMYKYYTKK